MVNIDTLVNKRRAKYNKLCLSVMKDIMKACPDMRFMQIIVDAHGNEDCFYKEPWETYEKLMILYSEIKKNTSIFVEDALEARHEC